MKLKCIKVIIVENHKFLVQMYNSVLRELESMGELGRFHISEARTYENGLALLQNLGNPSQGIDLAFLDLNISNLGQASHYEGIEIGMKVRSRFPEAKIMMMADYKNNYHINTTLRSIKPEGFFVMNDLDKEVLAPAVREALLDPPFYSKSVLKSLKKSNGHKFILDEWDERLLFELSQGRKMKDLPGILPLSLTAIEKRKRNLKSLFEIPGCDQNELLAKAREYGII